MLKPPRARERGEEEEVARVAQDLWVCMYYMRLRLCISPADRLNQLFAFDEMAIVYRLI